MTTVHYTGSQPDPAQREALIRELAACAKSMDWSTIDVADADAGLAGIIIQPANRLEPIPFLFDAEGRLHALADLLMPGGEPIYFVAVKTHYAGTDAHQWFTRLLRHIKDTFNRLELYSYQDRALARLAVITKGTGHVNPLPHQESVCSGVGVPAKTLLCRKASVRG